MVYLICIAICPESAIDLETLFWNPKSSKQLGPSFSWNRTCAQARQKRGGAVDCGRKHVFVLIFFGSFLYQDKKEHRRV
jgi:hypothetical protein